MSALIIAAAVVATVALPVLLVALTVFAEHTLPEPARTRRAPRRADR